MLNRVPSPEPGAIFGDLRVLIPDARLKPSKSGRRERGIWCHCRRCGNTKVINLRNLIAFSYKTCGCGKGNNKHGWAHHLLYKTWKDMKDRCSNPKNKRYSRYGGRGITYCKEWESLDQFIIDMGERPEGTSLDRIDNDGNYEPGNCRWATKDEQNNNRCNNIYLTFKNETLTIAQWAKKLNIKYATIRYRIENGWTVEKALTIPVRPRAR